MALKDTLFGTPKRTMITLGAATLLLVLFLKRKKVAKAATVAAEVVGEAVSNVATSAQLAAVKLLMPKGTEYIADLAFELGPQYDVSPYIILGITYSESDFGRALKPQGPGGTGDFLARDPGRCVARNNAGKCTKVLSELVRELNFPIKTNSKGELVPTERGWGHGLYQIDLMSHYPFIATGDWADARKAMEYALKLYTSNRAQIQKAFPGLGPIDLVRATVASYNAGAGGVIAALKAGVPADKLDTGTKFSSKTKTGTRVTYHAGYVGKVLDKGSALTPKNVA